MPKELGSTFPPSPRENIPPADECRSLPETCSSLPDALHDGISHMPPANSCETDFAQTPIQGIMSEIQITRLSPVRRAGVDGHIEKINERLPGTILEIGKYLEMQRHEMRPSSLNTLAGGVKFAVKKAIGQQYMFDLYIKFCVDQFFAQFYTSKQAYTSIEPVPQEHIRELMEKSGLRTGLWVEFLYRSACRVTEACTIRLSAMRAYDAEVSILIEGKGLRKRPISLPTELVSRVRWVCKSKTYLFENQRGLPYDRNDVYQMITAASRKILGYSINPHLLRHSWCQHMYEKHPEKLNALVKHAGHSVDVFVRKYNNQKLRASDLPALLILMVISVAWEAIGGWLKFFY